MHSILEVPRADWLLARSAARELDIERGGYCDARHSKAIHFWAGPENKPHGFEYEFLTGIFPAPRAYLGRATAELLHIELVRVTLEVRNEAARVAALAAAEAAGLPAAVAAAAEQQAMGGTAEDLAWLQREFLRLCRYASGGMLD